MSATAFLQQYRDQGILIDTNLMLLLAVGAYNPTRIQTFKRTNQYTLEDYALMLRVLAYFPRRITTPNILTEVDNLSRQLRVDEYPALSAAFGALVSQLFEVHVFASRIMQSVSYAAVGITDATTIEIEDVLVITDDFNLWGELLRLGRDAINLNHLRPMAWV